MSIFKKYPNRMASSQKKISAMLYKKLRSLKGEVREYWKRIRDAEKSGLYNYEYSETATKRREFLDWLEKKIEEIKNSSAPEIEKVIETSFLKTVRDSQNKLEKTGYSEESLRVGFPNDADKRISKEMLPPQLKESLSIVQARAIDSLDGVTSEMSKQIRLSLTEGLQSGDNPLDIAEDINNRVDKIGITRARTIARTETANAHVQALADTFELAEVEGIEVEVESVTGADPCPICTDLASKTFTIQEFRKNYPAHPNCECSAIPVRKNRRIKK